MTTKKRCQSEVQNRVNQGNVQAGTPVQAGVDMRLNSLITMMRGQNVQALDRIFQDSRLKCPSGSQFLKDLDMDMKVDFIWLPIDRVAMLLNKNLKTIRRMVDAGNLRLSSIRYRPRTEPRSRPLCWQPKRSFRQSTTDSEIACANRSCTLRKRSHWEYTSIPVFSWYTMIMVKI